MTVRFPVAAALSAVITFGLLFTMQALIATGRAVLEEDKPRWQLDFVRLKRDETVNTRKRIKPKKLDRPEPPPPAAPPAETAPTDVEIDIPILDAALALGDGPSLSGGADSDVVPMVRVNPQYPQRAASRGIEGWVHLSFSVTAQGATSEIEVVAADPRGYFESAAKAAVGRYKYKPKIEGGQAVARPGVEVVLSFELEK